MSEQDLVLKYKVNSETVAGELNVQDLNFSFEWEVKNYDRVKRLLQLKLNFENPQDVSFFRPDYLETTIVAVNGLSLIHI